MPTDIQPATRFYLPGTGAILLFAAIAATTRIPSTSEMTAATNLTPEVDDIAGWTTAVAWVETKDASRRYRPVLPGAITSDASSITFNGSKDGVDARSIFALDQTGFVGFADGGLGTGKKMDVYPISVGNIARLRSYDNAAFKVRVDFGITSQPTYAVALP